MDALALATRDLLDRSRAEGRRRVNAVRRPLIVIAVALLLPAFASVGAFAVLGDGPFDDMPLIGKLADKAHMWIYENASKSTDEEKAAA